MTAGCRAHSTKNGILGTLPLQHFGWLTKTNTGLWTSGSSTCLYSDCHLHVLLAPPPPRLSNQNPLTPIIVLTTR